MSEDNLLALAKNMVLAGDGSSAEHALRARLKIHPVHADTVITLAELLLNSGRNAEALALLEQYRGLRDCVDWLREYYIGERLNTEAVRLLQSTPKSGSIADLIDQAVLLQISGDIRAAAALCQKVLQRQAENAFAHNHLGRALFNAGQTTEARQAFERATHLAPHYAQAWHNLGHVLRAQQHHKEALTSYRKALALAPYYQSAMLNLALLHMGQGHHDEAITQLQRLLTSNAQHAEALLNLGICHHIQRAFDSAKTAFAQAIAADPQQARAWRHMGGLLREMQDGTTALDYYRKALSLTPGDADLRAELVATLELLNALDEAEQLVAEGLALTPDDAGLLFESAKLHRRRHNHDAAWQTIRRIDLSRLPSRLTLAFHYEYATAADRNGHYDTAFTAYTQGNALALTSIRARNTDTAALPKQITRMREWLERGAPSSPNGAAADLGKDLCFLIGFPRSGTTLLDVMLDGHSQILSLEEKPTVEQAAFALDQLPGHYPDAMASLSSEQYTQLRAIYRTQIAAYHKPEHHLVIDKMPIRSIHAAFIHRLFPEAKFIFSERHPCDVVLSNFMQHYALNDAMIHFTRMTMAVDLYDQVMNLWQLTTEKLPTLQIHRVRYESLTESPGTTLREVCAFLELPWQESLTQHQKTLEQRQPIQTNSYHQVTEPLYQRSKYRWRNYHKHLEPYLHILQPHIDRMGY